MSTKKTPAELAGEVIKQSRRLSLTAPVDDDFPYVKHEFDGAVLAYAEVIPKNVARPRIVCLCGSTKFKEAFERANFNETMNGNIVLTVGAMMHADSVKLTSSQKDALDELHKRKIDLADEIFVINAENYIGESTRSEIAYAEARGKKIRYLVQ